MTAFPVVVNVTFYPMHNELNFCAQSNVALYNEQLLQVNWVLCVFYVFLFKQDQFVCLRAVSYTHLTLPTIYSV